MTTAGIFLLPNGTFFIELAVSLVLIFAIYKWVLPPLNKAMEERQEKIRTSLEAADQARADAEAADDERRSVLEQARQQAREIVATANRTAEQVRTDAQARGTERVRAPRRQRRGRDRPRSPARASRRRRRAWASW